MLYTQPDQVNGPGSVLTPNDVTGVPSNMPADPISRHRDGFGGCMSLDKVEGRIGRINEYECSEDRQRWRAKFCANES